MNKKQFIIIFIISICFSFILLGGCMKNGDSAETKTTSIDLDNNGKKEIIKIEGLTVKVFNADKERLGGI